MPSWMRRVLDPLLPVDRFTRSDRRIVFVIWVAGVVQGFAQAQASASLPFWSEGLGLTEGGASLLLGIARLAAFPALILGWLGDHRGRRRPFLLAITLLVAGGTIAGLAFEAWQFGAAHAVLRVGTTAASGLAVVILAENVSPTIRAYSITFYAAAISLGSGLALAVFPLGSIDWRIPHLLIAAGFLLIPFLVRRVPETRVYEQAPTHEGRWRELMQRPWSRRFWTIVVIGFLTSVFSTVALTFSTTRLHDDIGLSEFETVLVSLVGGTLGGIGFFVGGHLADAWGRRNTSALSIVIAVPGGFVLYWAEAVPILLVAVFVSSFGVFAFPAAAGSHRAELFPTSLRSSANTAATNAAVAGSGTGLILGFWSIDTLGLSQWVTALSVLMLVAAALTMTLPETRGQDLTAVETADL